MKPITNERVEKLMIDAGWAINANGGKCEIIERALIDTLSLCVDIIRDLSTPKMMAKEKP